MFDDDIGLDTWEDRACLRGYDDGYGDPDDEPRVVCSRGSSTRRKARKQEVSTRAAADTSVFVPEFLDEQHVTDPRDMLWRCNDGRVLRMGEMDTRHIFNSMKMLFNHIAEARGGVPVWFTRKYSNYQAKARGDCTDLREMALLVCVFAAEIELRGDLERQYWEPYFDMLAQMIPTPRMAEARLLIGGKDGKA